VGLFAGYPGRSGCLGAGTEARAAATTAPPPDPPRCPPFTAPGHGPRAPARAGLAIAAPAADREAVRVERPRQASPVCISANNRTLDEMSSAATRRPAQSVSPISPAGSVPLPARLTVSQERALSKAAKSISTISSQNPGAVAGEGEHHQPQFALQPAAASVPARSRDYTPEHADRAGFTRRPGTDGQTGPASPTARRARVMSSASVMLPPRSSPSQRGDRRQNTLRYVSFNPPASLPTVESLI